VFDICDSCTDITSTEGQLSCAHKPVLLTRPSDTSDPTNARSRAVDSTRARTSVKFIDSEGSTCAIRRDSTTHNRLSWFANGVLCHANIRRLEYRLTGGQCSIIADNQLVAAIASPAAGPQFDALINSLVLMGAVAGVKLIGFVVSAQVLKQLKSNIEQMAGQQLSDQIALYQFAGISMRAAPAASRQMDLMSARERMLMEVFDQFDADGKGAISFSQLGPMCQEAHVKLHQHGASIKVQ